MPLNHQAGIQGTLKQCLKILVDRTLMQHIAFLFDGISFGTQLIHVCTVSCHNN